MAQRRDFLLQMAATGALSALAPDLWAAGAPTARGNAQKKEKGYTVLFQGDSITDGNRTRNNDWNHVMGHGYAYLISSRVWYNSPEKEFRFFNRGISGNQITDLADRWQTDTLDLKPDLLSILIGVNDTWAAVKGDQSCTLERFETTYRTLLEKTLQQLPDTQLVFCVPFILPVGMVKDVWDACQIELAPRQAIVRQLAGEYKAICVDFQGAFTEASEKVSPEYWIWDGIHPMPAGHELMARVWLKQVGKKFRFMS